VDADPVQGRGKKFRIDVEADGDQSGGYPLALRRAFCRSRSKDILEVVTILIGPTRS
jgi:hypothetical protein